MDETIICGIDTEDDGYAAPLEVAAKLAERLGAHLVVAHVAGSGGAPVEPAAPPDHLLAPPPAPVLVYPAEGADDSPDFAPLRDEARARVERLVERCGVPGVEVAVPVDGSAADGLRRIAAGRRAALLVVGSRGRGTVSAALVGSTSRALAGDAPCPVVVVPRSAASG